MVCLLQHNDSFRISNQEQRRVRSSTNNNIKNEKSHFQFISSTIACPRPKTSHRSGAGEALVSSSSSPSSSSSLSLLLPISLPITSSPSLNPLKLENPAETPTCLTGVPETQETLLSLVLDGNLFTFSLCLQQQTRQTKEVAMPRVLRRLFLEKRVPKSSRKNGSDVGGGGERLPLRQNREVG